MYTIGRLVCLLLLVCACVAVPNALSAQEDESASTEPEPYEDEEFADWLHAVRRFEVVALGSFPLTYFLTILVYDFYTFAAESVNIGAVNPLYAPLFFAPPNKPPPSQEDTVALIAVAAVVSLVVAIVDLIIHEVQRARIAQQTAPANNTFNSVDGIKDESVPDPPGSTRDN